MVVGMGYAAGIRKKVIASFSLLCYTWAMALNTSVPVRFNQTQDARLRAISEQSGMAVSALIRIATERYLDQIEAAGQVTVNLAGRYPAHRASGAELNDKPKKGKGKGRKKAEL